MEVLVVAAITIIVTGGVWSFLRSMTHTAAISKAKGEAKAMADLVLRAIEKDITDMAASVTIELNNRTKVVTQFSGSGGTWTMLVGEKGRYTKVDYLFDPVAKTVTRSADGQSRVLADKVLDLTISPYDADQIKFLVDIQVGIVPPGLKEPQIHHQKLVATVRAAVSANMDPKWRTSEDAKTTF